jgi:hypothetical protein
MTGSSDRDERRERPAADRRGERLASALRENLKRRKAQARGRASDTGKGEAPQVVKTEKPR